MRLTLADIATGFILLAGFGAFLLARWLRGVIDICDSWIGQYPK